MVEEDRSTANADDEVSSLRVTPTALIGFGIAIGYMLFFLAMEKIMGVPYTELGKTTDSVVRGIVIPLAVGAVVLAGITTMLGWWRPVLREKRVGVRWMWAIPLLLFAAVLIGIDYSQLGALGGAYLIWLAIGTMLVGFCEEITYRGLSLVAFRGSYREVWVWLLSSLFFGALHGMNLFLGQGLGETLRQIGMAFVLGSVFYATRRVTGSLVVLMVIHALWDFGFFTYIGGQAVVGEVGRTGLLHAFESPLAIAALVLFVIAARRLFVTPGAEPG